jgi:hypothetical protein
MGKRILILLIALSFIFAQQSYAQIDLNKVKGKTSKIVKNKKNKQSETDKKTDEKTDEKANEKTNDKADDKSKDEEKEVVTTPGAYFYTAFKSTDFKESVNIGDELFVRFNLGKTMIEHASDLGLSASHSAFGFIVITINGDKVLTMGPYTFASNQSKVWKYFDVPLAVDPDFVEKISQDQSMLETSQDIWAFQQLFKEGALTKKYPEAAISKMEDGDNLLKVEFGLGESGDKAPKGIICDGEVKVLSDKEGRKELYKKGPKHLIPLNEEEAGKFAYSPDKFAAGSGTLTSKLELPHPPKYYNMRWCKATSCDYDHGKLVFAAFLDDTFLAAWTTKFEGQDYTETKSFSMTVLPQSDKGIDNNSSAFNTSKLFNDHNPVVYGLFDRIYGGRMKNGTHTLRLKVYSQECVPYSATYENTVEYHDTWNAIAENSVQLKTDDAGKTKLINASTAQKLTHAGGEWAAVDAHLKATLADGMPEIEIIDAAATTEWKVTVNFAGTPMYRDCKADVIYKSSEYGTRRLNGVKIREDYNGGSYGKPYATEVLNTYFYDSGASFGSMHYPVPLNKVR